MSRATKEINKVTGTVISVSVRLIIYALIILVLFEGVSKGYEFGHDIFYATSVSEPPGQDREVTIEDSSVTEAAGILKKKGLIKNEYSFVIQSYFYEYKVQPGNYTLNTSMTSKDILHILDAGEQEKEETGS